MHNNNDVLPMQLTRTRGVLCLDSIDGARDGKPACSHVDHLRVMVRLHAPKDEGLTLGQHNLSSSSVLGCCSVRSSNPRDVAFLFLFVAAV